MRMGASGEAASAPVFTFLCPVFITGGTEAIHQAAMVLNRLGAKAQIAYYGQGAQVTRFGEKVVCISAGSNACRDAFVAYEPVVATEFGLDPRHVVVLPEINALQAKDFRPARVVVWWLSVDNAIAHNAVLQDEAARLNFFAHGDVEHWYQSDYARRFLIGNGARNARRLSDFTPDEFTPPTPSRPNGGARVLYNRKKGAALAERFFAANPDLEPLALDGRSRAALIEAYRDAPIYVDFGSLPGKDRMPREAAACGCVVFVHNTGAGRELGDFPIHDVFRFDAGDLESGLLGSKLRAVLDDKASNWDLQAVFRAAIAQEHDDFVHEAEQVLLAHAASYGVAAPEPHLELSVPARPAPARAFDGSWATNKDRFCIWTIKPDNYVHVRAFDEVGQTLSEAFSALGGSAPIVEDPTEWAGRTPIVFGGHLQPYMPNLVLPPDAVLFNLEQVDRDCAFINQGYLSLMMRHPVLDYSHANSEALRRLGVPSVTHLPIGYVPGLSRIPSAGATDIDVLFYGSLNDRRREILQRLSATGLNVVHLFGAYGAERDAMIARAKVVLNLHLYKAAVFEIVRVSYLLANGKCVVTEGDENDLDSLPVRDGLCICTYDEIVERCVALVADETLRNSLAARGFEAIKQRPQAEILRAAFAA